MTHRLQLGCWVMTHYSNWSIRCMTQTCQQGLWGHDPDPELGVQGHEPDHPSTGSQAEGLWAARGGGSWAAAGRLAAEEEAVRARQAAGQVPRVPEAMGGEASGRGAREDRRGARTPKPHAMTSMMRRLHHAADGGGSGWVMAASA